MVVALVLSLGLALPVHDGMPEHDKWFQSLHTPNGFPCCDRADCKNVPARLNADGDWEAWVDSKTFPDEPPNQFGVSMHGRAPNAWVVVPRPAVLENEDNPTPGSVLCWWNGKPLCLVPGVGD